MQQNNKPRATNGAKSVPSVNFGEILKCLSTRHESRKVFDAFVLLSACALAGGSREKEYLDEAQNWTKPELETFSEALGSLILEMESHPFEDILGPYYLEFVLSSGAKSQNGECYTPNHVCDLMAQILLGGDNSIPQEGPITVCEPACGAGAMILSSAKALHPEQRRRLRVTAIDRNRTACDMTFVNTTLWGVPTMVFHGDSITMEMFSAWSNIHWMMPWLHLHPARNVLDLAKQGLPPDPAEQEQIASSLVQMPLRL